jgi:hypothetical protein
METNHLEEELMGKINFTMKASNSTDTKINNYEI